MLGEELAQLGRAVMGTAAAAAVRPTANFGADRADSGAGEHGDHGLGDHREVDNGPVAFGNTLCDKRSSETRNLVEQLAVGVALLGARHCGVVDQHRALTFPESPWKSWRRDSGERVH